MFSEPPTPSTVFEDSFPETRHPVFDAGSGDTSIIQTKLNRRLGPEYVSQRPAPGGGPKLTYVEGWKMIGLANEVFGYNGWCSTVTRIETDFIDMDPESRRFSVGITALVKVTLRDGTYHEDIGYGTGENLKSKGAALDKAKKEAVTDGVKRALRNFGNLLGLCLYEKSFTQEVVKIKPQLPKFDESDLHRRESRSLPSTSGTNDVSSATSSERPEDIKPIPSGPPQSRVRQATTKPSPLRNAVLGARAFQDEQGLATGSQTGVSTVRERPVQLKHQAPGETHNVPSTTSKARPLQTYRTLPHEAQLPQPKFGSERNVASTPSPGRFDVKSVPPPPREALDRLDSDPDIYFNDEDNDAFLAIEDSFMRGVESRGVNGQRRADRNVIKNESPGGAGSSRSQVATMPATTRSNQNSTPSLDRPMSMLRRAIRSSTVSSTVAGVKRPAEVIQSQYPQPISVEQQQRFTTNSNNSNGRREPLSDLPVQGGTDVKRIKR